MERESAKAGVLLRVFIAVLCLVFGGNCSSGSAEPAAASAFVSDPWNFTPGDFRRLRRLGKFLTLANGSKWFPRAFEKTFLRTLEFVLSEDDGVVRTTGVHHKDFYHCHFLCKGRCSGELEQTVESFEREFSESRRRALGDENYDLDITADNLVPLVEVIKEHEPMTRHMVENVIRERLCADPAILCHTFEDNKPSEMRYGDSRRTILTFLGQAPKGYTPPDMDYATSYRDEFCHLEQIPFLIDQKGTVYVTVGLDSNLVRFTGIISGPR